MVAIWLFLHTPHTPAVNTAGDDLLTSARLEVFSALETYAKPPQRPVFPYSIIPGGIRNKEELRSAMAKDSAVAKHYADFALAKTHLIRLNHERAVYVSFRIGNQIFWTKRKLHLARGESLITDGTHTARTRCGNRISEVPKVPVSPNEPTVDVFNTPVFPDPSSPSNPLPWLSPAPPSVVSPPSGPNPSIFIPPLFPIFPFGGGGAFPPPVFPPTPAPSPAPVATPEPGSLLLLSTGLSTVWFLSKMRRR